MGKQLETAILYTVFNRLDVTEETFKEIRRVKPKKLFIGADGPRNKEEKMKTDSVRKYILKNIDWECEVKTMFSEKNLGSNVAVTNAINWFFRNVEEGIILEDDDLASGSFFLFCEEMLRKYKDKKEIMSISGFTPIKTGKLKESYYFARHFGCWGWATWKDRWDETQDFLSKISRKEIEKDLDEVFSGPLERLLVRRRFKYNLARAKGWDYIFSFLHYKNHRICIKAKSNLVKNLGFIEESTNTSSNFMDKKFLSLKEHDLKFPLVHPKKIEVNKKLCSKELRTDAFRSLTKLILTKLGIIKYKYKY